MEAAVIPRFVRSMPVATTIAALVSVIAVATGSLLFGPPPNLQDLVATGLETVTSDGQFVTLLTATLFASSWVELLVFVVVVLVVVGGAERVLGPWRTAVSYIVTACGGIAVGLAVQALGRQAPQLWVGTSADSVLVDPFIPVVGTALAASAFCGPLWRRRIRVLGLAGSVMVLLYSGQSADLYRASAAVVGLLLGMVLARRSPRIGWARSSHHEARGLLAALVAMSAVGPFLSVFAPKGYGLLRPLGLLFRDTLPSVRSGRASCVDPANCVSSIELARLNGPGPVLLTVLPLLVLLVAAVGISRGRRVAIVVAIGVSGLLALLAAVFFGFAPGALTGGPAEPPGGTPGRPLQTALAVLVPAGLCALLVANLRHCSVPASPSALRRYVVAVVLTVGGLSGAFVALSIVPGSFDPPQTPAGLLADLPERFIPVGFLRQQELDFVPVGQLATLLFNWIGAAGWSVLLVGLVITSSRLGLSATPSDDARVRSLLRAGSTGSLAFMATWEGNRHWFAADGLHAVAYRVEAGIALTLGEPVGSDAGRVEAAREFAVFCDDQGWIPVFYATRPDFHRALRVGLPWAGVSIGEDTVIDTVAFSMKGKKWQDIRTSMNRATRAEIAAVWTRWQDLTLAQRSQIEAISEEWLTDRDLPEMGFTLGGLEQVKDQDVQLMLAVGPDARVQAVTSWLPSFEDGITTRLTLDFMRRRTDSMNGLMEFLIASTIVLAQERGIATVSLSVAPLTSSVPPEVATALTKVLDRLAEVLEPAYGFRSLAAFKTKFAPRHDPVLMVYPDAVSMPAIAVALSRAYLPGLSVKAALRLMRTLQ